VHPGKLEGGIDYILNTIPYKSYRQYGRAARVFAGEYGSSTLSIQDDDPQNPAWVVTPGGAWCRSMFLSGALTEVTESEIWYAPAWLTRQEPLIL